MEKTYSNIWAREIRAPKRKSMVDSIVYDIEQKIANRDLKPGDRIPSESEMCEYYSVSRGTIREAMKVLSAIGLIKIVQGDGTYINCEVNSQLMYPALLSLIMSNSNIYDIMELRDAIEHSAMRLAVKKATDGDVKYCQMCFNKFKEFYADESKAVEEQVDADIMFHRSFALATHNELMIMVHDLIMQYCKPFIQGSYMDRPKNIEYAIRVHSLMMEALLKRDLALCDMASKENVNEWTERMGKTFGDTTDLIKRRNG